jgi:rhomboid protease GluP
MRQTQGSIVCPSCGKLIEIDEERCPFCGRWKPGMFGYAQAYQRLWAVADPTNAITFFCIGMYLASLAMNLRAALTPHGGLFGLLSPAGEALYALGMTYGHSLKDGRWYTMLSAIFLHGGLLHIFFNLLWIRSLGPTVEDGFGRARYFIIFMVAGVGGFWLSNLLGGPYASRVGASGGVFGLLAATVVYGRNHGGSFGDAVSQRALMWAVFLLVFGFMMPRVDNMAHLGGFAFGYLAARLFLPYADRKEGPLTQAGALLFAVATVAAVILSLVTTVPELMQR